MLDDFFIRAIIAGTGVALVAGPLGCFIVWRRLSYFGDTLAHGALLGVALAILLEVNTMLAVFAVSIMISLILSYMERRGGLASDALLGLLSHSSLALGMIALAAITWVQIDLMGLLFGDILAVSKTDIVVIYVGGALVLGMLAYFWKPLFAATVNRELAEAEGLKPDRANLLYTVLLATVIAIAMKIVGVLLITAMLIIPAAAARRFASSPERMAVVSALIGVAAVSGGLFGSLQWDTPSGPSIVLAALLLFVPSLFPGERRHDRL